VMAVIRSESVFNANATSHVGARGLMQLMPRTAAWIAQMLRWANFSQEILANPSDNIEFGCYYLAYLRDSLGATDEALPWVLAAYNGGIGNVKRWMEMKATVNGQPDLEAIEFKETRDYIRKVTEAHRIYESLYGEQFPDEAAAEPEVNPMPDPSPSPAKKPARRKKAPRGRR
jgi:soluble lytic murein transglycosylase